MSRWKTTQEPSLDELLADDIMKSMLKSAGLDAEALKQRLAEMARRLRSGGAAPLPRRSRPVECCCP